jgi:hypothetical protein
MIESQQLSCKVQINCRNTVLAVKSIESALINQQLIRAFSRIESAQVAVVELEVFLKESNLLDGQVVLFLKAASELLNQVWSAFTTHRTTSGIFEYCMIKRVLLALEELEKHLGQQVK